MYDLCGPLLAAALTGYNENFSIRAVVASSLELPRSLCYCLRVRSSYVAKVVYEFRERNGCCSFLRRPTSSPPPAACGFTNPQAVWGSKLAAAFDAGVVHAIPVSSPSSLACASVASRAESSSSELPLEPVLRKPAAQEYGDDAVHVVSLVIVTARYYWASHIEHCYLPLHVVVRDAARTLLNLWVDCRTVSSLSLDATDTVAAAALSEGATVFSCYDEVVKLLARNLVDCFMVVYNCVELFESLWVELHPEQVFDLGTSVLLRNDALRCECSCRSRSRRGCLPLADIWQPILRGQVPTYTESIAAGLLAFFGSVRVQCPPTRPVDGAVFKPIPPWRSSARVLSLDSSLFAEAVSDCSVALKILRSLTSVAPLITLAQCPSPCSFVVKLPPTADSFRVAAVNALLRLSPIAGFALLSLLVERGVVWVSFVDDAARVQRDRLRACELDTFTYAVELSRADVNESRTVQEVLRVFLNFDDEAIVNRARLIDFPGITVPDTL